ncbi:MAG: hypothetical protein QOE70_3622 [Chthoniobacter sp.]|jgi:hypothetical protein|nr:hypothetical protein [Chthoniobacter sp.]
MLDLAQATCADFAACLDQPFSLPTAAPAGFALTLIEARLLGPRPGATREPFALKFKAAQPIRLPQAIYRLENERLGAMEIFLVQIAPAEVEAVFN